MTRIIFAIVVFLVSTPGYSQSIQTMTIFISEGDRVYVNQQVQYSVEVFNIRHFDATSDKLDEKVQERVRSNGTVMSELENEEMLFEAYREAYSSILNGPEWPAIQSEFRKGATILREIVQYGVQKTPAVLINEKYLIYGTASQLEAERIFLQSGAMR